jgi:hypothetical protein
MEGVLLLGARLLLLWSLGMFEEKLSSKGEVFAETTSSNSEPTTFHHHK